MRDTDKKIALLIIDCQKGIDESEYWGGNRNNPEAEKNIEILLQHWRKWQLPLFHIQHLSVNHTSPLLPGQPGNEIKEFARPLPGEIIIQKTGVTSAFVHTPLQSILAEQGIQTLVIAGFVTNNSVEATARMAGNLGFHTFVISDACAAFNLRGLNGEIFDSQLVHNISLANLQGEYATVVTTQEIVKQIQELYEHTSLV
ncbi:cysteine hydrolase [Rhodocytophaga rosea]|uniref:Cysteine hydrolase n=1 Tax=Rhodocytophaga rosea TaxID=2704465 RepID=A0A6C0GRI3_9BACT|nr:cysteine hydrolase family protein [Rhodocytophaga rosea]QHT70100.1 cysteine hydrolase [Rhodocytophaga rosea]